MSTSVRLEMDNTDKILLKRNLNKNGEGQRFFTSTVRRMADPYVPMRTGVLKNTAVEYTSSIYYGQPYARRQYYENKGNGMRGKQWDKRMWADHGKEIVSSVAKFCGGRSE